MVLRLNSRKTSTKQGVSLFPDVDSFLTCPVLAIAVALAMTTHPCKRIFYQVPGEQQEQQEQQEHQVDGELDLLHQLVDTLIQEADPENAPRKSSTVVHSYVNRLLDNLCRIASSERRLVTTGLSSHSFWRGAAQHANADHLLSPNWILDRGGWQLSQMNKGSAKIFNTMQENQQVSKIPRAWVSNLTAHFPDLSQSDSGSRSKIDKFKATVFAASVGFSDTSLNVGDDVLDVLTASLIFSNPEMLEMGSNSPYILRIRHCLASASLHESDLKVWAIEMKKKPQAAVTQDETSNATSSLNLSMAL